MPGEASWIPLGWIISSSCAKLSCWEPASLSGNSLHTSSPPTCTFCAQCIPLRCACPLWREVVIYYHCNKYGCVLAELVLGQNQIQCFQKVPSTVGVVCKPPCPCAHHTALQKCLHTAQCTLWRKVVIHYHCNT